MHLMIRTDGGARGNPGPAAAGAVITDADGEVLSARGYYLGETTNNVAEYEAVLRGLQEAERLGGTELEIFCDSELIVKQINGQYRVKNAKLKTLHSEAMKRIQSFAQVKVQHVYREENTVADSLVNQALDVAGDVEGAAGQ